MMTTIRETVSAELADHGDDRAASSARELVGPNARARERLGGLTGLDGAAPRRVERCAPLLRFTGELLPSA